MDAIIDMVMDLPAVEGEELFPMQDLLADPVLQDLGKAKQQAPCNEVRRSLRQHPASKGRTRKQQYGPVEREIKRQRRDEQRKVKAETEDSRRQRNKGGLVKRRAEIRAREGAQVSVFLSGGNICHPSYIFMPRTSTKSSWSSTSAIPLGRLHFHGTDGME